MRKRVDRLFPILLAVWILTSLVLPAWATEESTVTISNVADLQRFGKNCALDTWSQGKTVTLTADLDLSGVDFTPIPTFGGTFLGQGHTISGLCLTSAGSTQGLFRYIQPGGLVRDLTVKGTVAPGYPLHRGRHRGQQRRNPAKLCLSRRGSGGCHRGRHRRIQQHHR